MKRRYYVLLLFVVMGSMVMEASLSVNIIATYAKSGKDITTLSKSSNLELDRQGKKTIFTDVKIRLNNVPITEVNPLRKGDTFQILYEFAIPDDLGKEMADGDYFKFKLPKSDVIKLTEPQSGKLVEKVSQREFGTYQATIEGDVTMTFNSKVQENDHVAGTLSFLMEMDEQKIKIPGGYPINVPGSVNTNNEVIYIATKIKTYIQKEFIKNVPDTTGNLTAKWKILLNPNKNKIENPKLFEKTIDMAGKEVAKSYQSEKLVKASVDLDGNITERETVDTDLIFDDSGELEMPFTLSDTYVLYLNTPFIYDSEGEVTNQVYLSGSNIVTEKASASVTLPLKKDVVKEAGEYDQKRGIINWTITFNPERRIIPKEAAKFEDELGEGSIFLKDTLKVEPNVDYNLKETKTGFEFEFKKDVTESIKITYQSEVKDKNAGVISNFVWNRGKIIRVFKEIPTGGGDNGGVSFKSSITKSNPVEQMGKQLIWNLTINEEKSVIDYWKVSDKLSSGELVESSLSVHDMTEDGKKLVPKVDYTINWKKDSLGITNGFIVNYNRKTNHVFKISYKSIYKGRTEQSNKADYLYRINDVEKGDSATKIFKPKSGETVVLSKSGRFIPSSREIEWDIKVNLNRAPIGFDNLLIDQIPSDQIFVKGSESVGREKWYEGPFQSTSYAKISYDKKKDMIKATFEAEDKSVYLVRFRTRLKDKSIIPGKEIINIAEYQDDVTNLYQVKGSLTEGVGNKLFVEKKGIVNTRDKNILDWTIQINPNQLHLKNVEILDHSWQNQRVISETVKLVQTTGTESGKILKENSDYVLDYTERNFHIVMKKDVTETIELTYQGQVIFPDTASPGQMVPIKNGITVKGSNFKIIDNPYMVTVFVAKSSSSGEIYGDTHSLRMVKKDKDTGKVLEGADLTLYRGKIIDKNKIVDRKVTSKSGEALFDKLVNGDYLLVETKAPTGYGISEELETGVPIKITNNDPLIMIKEIVNSDITKTKITIPVDKKWKGVPINQTTPDVTVYLNADGVFKEKMVLTKTNNYKGMFENLEKFKISGEKINYTIFEEDIPNYDGSISGTTFTNTYTEKLNINGDKIWKDNNNKAGKRPKSVNIYLYKNNEMLDQQEVKQGKDNRWTYSFEDLDKYDSKGVEYNYRVSEKPVTFYETSYQGNDVINTYKNTEVVNLFGQKKWDDYDDKFKTRPGEITVILFKNNARVDEKEIKADESGNWNYEFTDLSKYDELGELNIYRVEEKEVPHYTTTITGTTIINTYRKKEMVSVSGEKKWEDYNNKFKTRPNSILLELRQNNRSYEKLEVLPNESGNWSYEFTELPKYDELGKEYVYSIVEEKVPNYTTKKDGRDIINTYVNNDITEINGKKIWNDYNNRFDTRPSEIEVVLEQDGNTLKKQKIAPKNNESEWQYSFTQLPKYDVEGREFVYTVKEEKIEGYISEVKGNNLINTYINSEKTSLKVEKKWEDNDNILDKRPDSIRIFVLRNNERIDNNGVLLSEENNWYYEFKALDKYDSNGDEYRYRVIEDVVSGYDSQIKTDDDTQTATITNKYVSVEEVNIKGEKIWDDYADLFRKRPKEIIVSLYKNNLLFKKETVKSNKNGDWKYEFLGLPKYDDGIAENEYRLEENLVEGYEQPQKYGNSFINSYINKETVKIQGEKIWDDYDNSFNTRPFSIELILLRDQQEIDKQTIASDSEGNWIFEFTDLIKYDDGGVLYDYQVLEAPVNDYQSSVDVTKVSENEAYYTFTNQYQNKEAIEFVGEKTWDDYGNKFKTRPEYIRVNLIRNKKLINNKLVYPDIFGHWFYEFHQLDKYDENGVLYDYEVQEEPVLNYQTELVGNNIINHYKNQENLTFKGNKIWDDYGNKFKYQPLEITVDLFRNGALIDTKQVEKSTNWHYNFNKEYAKYDEQGNEFKYEVIERDLLDYETLVDEKTGNIMNTYINKEVTSLTGNKYWIDSNNKSNTRPNTIIIELYQNGKKIDEQNVSNASNWIYEFKDLLMYDKLGGFYKYEVKEKEVPAYNSIKVQNNFINKLMTTKLSGEKIWKDQNNKLNTRPSSITVELYQNGGDKPYEIKEVHPTTTGNWMYVFNNLPKYDKELNDYVYTVKEVKVEHYETVLEGNNITNIYKPVKPTEPSPTKPTKRLPKTGDNIQKNYDIIGLVVLIFMLILYIKRKKHNL